MTVKIVPTDDLPRGPYITLEVMGLIGEFHVDAERAKGQELLAAIHRDLKSRSGSCVHFNLMKGRFKGGELDRGDQLKDEDDVNLTIMRLDWPMTIPCCATLCCCPTANESLRVDP